MGFEWNEKIVVWYDEALQFSNFPEKVMEMISPYLSDDITVLDVGCGPGTLALPLAEKVESVTALDPSNEMLKSLKQRAGGITNIEIVNSGFDLYDKYHDILISSNVFNLWAGNEDLLKKADSMAGSVFLILPAGLDRDKFYFKELYPILYDKKFGSKDDYLKVYTQIHKLGICADISLFDYRFDQRFKNIEEAVDFWQSYLNDYSGKTTGKLKSFLEKKLKKTDDGLIAEFPKKVAIIWWSTKSS